jgi:excisionase family DNA binding protein
VLTTEEVAELIGCKRGHVAALARKGVFQSVRDKNASGVRHRFIEAEIAAFLDHRADKEPPPKRLKYEPRGANMKRNPRKTVEAVRMRHYKELRRVARKPWAEYTPKQVKQLYREESKPGRRRRR